MFVPLRKLLVDICSFDDLIQQMMSYLSLDTYKEIFKTMTEVTKDSKLNCCILCSFKSSKEEALVEEGVGAVSKSFQKGKEMVEELAEVATTITGEALHKTKDKIKNTF
ncbi:hypothetical protein ACFE04_023712 [Oxalis oulophora]